MMQADPRFDELRSAVLRDLRPVRPLRPAWQRALVLLPWLLLVFAGLALGLGLRFQSAAVVWALAAAQIATAYAVLWLALREAVPGQSASRVALAWTALGAIAVPLALYVWTLWTRPRPIPGHLFRRDGIACFTVEILLGLPAAALALGLASRGLPGRPAATGALAGLAVGVATVGLWNLFCPFTSPSHVLPSHVAPLALLALGGLLLGGIWARLRRRKKTSLRGSETKTPPPAN